jgi:DNA-binding MarR family transcriptional regulator
MSNAESSCLRDLPPSAKLVYKTLQYADEPLTQQQLTQEARLSARTARYGLRKLEAIGAVNERISFTDARQSLYTLAPEAGC